MDNTTFENVVQNQLNYCKVLLKGKGTEYNKIDREDDTDRLLFFKKAAALQGISAKEALVGMMAKHTVSIYNMCKDDQAHSLDKWEEKITDHINYLLLLKALVSEEAHEQI